MDAQQRLVFDSEISFTCLGRGAEFVLIDNYARVGTEHLEGLARESGYTFCGVFGIGKDGVPRVESEADPNSRHRMLHAGLTFCCLVSDRLRHPMKGDSVTWLRNLHGLQDTRGCVNA